MKRDVWKKLLNACIARWILITDDYQSLWLFILDKKLQESLRRLLSVRHPLFKIKKNVSKIFIDLLEDVVRDRRAADPHSSQQSALLCCREFSFINSRKNTVWVQKLWFNSLKRQICFSQKLALLMRRFWRPPWKNSKRPTQLSDPITSLMLKSLYLSLWRWLYWLGLYW